MRLAASTRLARGKGRTIRCAQIHSSAASMTGISAHQASHDRLVRGWLISIAALIAIMVLVGGATRLTESGLSIVEWKPVTGALPPLNQEQWTQAFDAYKTIPQYRQLNDGMSLDEFKTIFWWEWSHRLLGRVIGMAYLLPFLWFLWRGVLGAELQAAVVADLRPRRAAGRGRLVDGGVGTFATGRGFAISSCHPSGAGAPDFCRHRLDAAPAASAGAVSCIRTAENHGGGPAGADVRAALSGRAGRGTARGEDLQHLAGNRRRFHSLRVATFL